ncbi:hypothetical protein IWQ62_006520 [Dispira parvispora]|uniref:Uncharacterized protein n=1 Tax=Dispira parvispora TaxID=1520584 RepID=A0A9W8AMV7_9FUNG|nr:hypothetical protein IWQ62_006520 [Dispira parvispora]
MDALRFSMSLQHRDLTHARHGGNNKSACNAPSAGGTTQASASPASSAPSSQLITNPQLLPVASQETTPLKSSFPWLSFLGGSTHHN